MVKTNGDTHQPLLPRLGWDSKRAPIGPTPRHLINKAKRTVENHRKQDSQDTFSSYPTHQNLQSIFPHRGPLQLNPHWPYRSLPIHFPMRQQIYHGGNPPQCKLHLCWTYARSKEEMIRAYEKIINRMRLAGLGLKKHTLDNKALEAFKQCIWEQQMQYKVVPLGNHQCNQAEHTIQMFKLHFISILAGVNDKFPLSLWCHLLKLTELTLNLLCQSKVAPKILAFTHICGPHDYMDKTICTSRLHNSSPFQTRGPPHMGHMSIHWFKPWQVNGTSPVFPGVHHKNMGNTNQRHGFLQTPSHHKPNHLTGIPRDRSSSATNNCNQRKLTNRQRDCWSIAKCQQAIHQKSNDKKQGSRGQGQSQQGPRNSSCMTNNAPSKGGSTHSKGGNANSKSDRKPWGAPHPGRHRHTTQRLMHNINFLPTRLCHSKLRRPPQHSPMRSLTHPYPTTSPRMKMTLHPPQDEPPDQHPEASCRKLCCHVWTYKSHNTLYP